MGNMVVVFGKLALLALLFAAAFYVFDRVGADYRAHGKLTRLTAILQTGYFCCYALCSYAFLDSRLSHINTQNPLFILSVGCMLAGFLAVILSMPFLGRRSFGTEVGSLLTNGIYRFSRNPQLIGGFIFIVGYALLWPSWSGALWAVLWLISAHLMVRAEEPHLERVFGKKYRAYCARTPRYPGLPRK